MTPDEQHARCERLRKAMAEDVATMRKILDGKVERRRTPQKIDSETFGVAPATIPPFRDQLDCPPPSPCQWSAMIEHVSRYGCLPPGDGTGHVQTRDSWPCVRCHRMTPEPDPPPPKGAIKVRPGTPEPPPPVWVRRAFLACYYAVSLAGWVAIAAAVVHYAGGGR